MPPPSKIIIEDDIADKYGLDYEEENAFRIVAEKLSIRGNTLAELIKKHGARKVIKIELLSRGVKISPFQVSN